MEKSIAKVRWVFDLLKQSEWFPILVVRLSVGLVFFDSGRHKLAKLPEMAAYFASLGIPAPGLNAIVACSTECFGGLLLMLGLGTRIWSALLAFVMLVAIVTAAHKEAHGFLEFLYLHEWGFLITFGWLLFAGGGKVSVDHLIGKRFTPKKAAPASAAE